MGLLDRLLDKSIVFDFDRTGFERHAKRFNPADLDVDLSGHRALVTGGNSGLGFETARGLCKRGASVVLLCRNPERAERAVASLRDEFPGSQVEWARVDLSDFESVRRYTANIGSEPIDILVQNAGVLLDKRSMNDEGVELTFATNVVGPWLLMRGLWPQLAFSRARVIHVASGGMYGARLSVNSLLRKQGVFDGVRTYAQTKRAQVVLTELLSDRQQAVNISSMHPGWADTPGVLTSLPRFHRITQRMLRSPAQGADTIVWLAASEEPPRSGSFYFDRSEAHTHMRSATEASRQERERLFRTVCELAGVDPAFFEPKEFAHDAVA